MSLSIQATSAVLSAEDTFPDHFLCPITYEVMHDPVRDPSGHVYEHQALLRALRSRAVSPLTRLPLRPEQLQPATDLQTEIAAFPGAAAAAAQAATARLRLWDLEATLPRPASPVEIPDEFLPPARPAREPRVRWEAGAPAQRPWSPLPRAPAPGWPYRFIDPPTPRWQPLPVARRPAGGRPLHASPAWQAPWNGARAHWVGIF